MMIANLISFGNIMRNFEVKSKLIKKVGNGLQQLLGSEQVVQKKRARDNFFLY